MVITLVVVAVVALGLVGFAIMGFNKLRTTDIGAQEALGGIDVQLTRRAELIPNLVETVKGYASHEKGVFEEVTRARAHVQTAAAADDVPAKAAADADLTGALVNLNAVAENYPDLKANTNFLELQTQLAETENQISFARQYYNDAVVLRLDGPRLHRRQPRRRDGRRLLLHGQLRDLRLPGHAELVVQRRRGRRLLRRRWGRRRRGWLLVSRCITIKRRPLPSVEPFETRHTKERST